MLVKWVKLNVAQSAFVSLSTSRGSVMSKYYCIHFLILTLDYKVVISECNKVGFKSTISGRIQYYAKVTFLFLSVRTGYTDFTNNICIVTLQFTQSSAQIITFEAIKL